MNLALDDHQTKQDKTTPPASDLQVILSNLRGLIRDPADLYSLNVEQVTPLFLDGVAFFQKNSTHALIGKFKAAGVAMRRKTEPARITGKLAGRKFVLTGTLSSMTREEAGSAIRARGGAVMDSVSKATTGVVTGAEPGSKLEKARKLGVPILDETAFLGLLRETE